MKRLSTLLFLMLCFATPAAGQTCTPSPTTACLLDDRFQLQVAWTDVPGNPHTLPAWGLSGDGTVVLQEPRTALFSFFTPETPTMIVKIQNAAFVTGSFWLFASASTNVAFTLTVTDTVSGQSESYINPQGMIASPIYDFNTFPSSSSGVQAGSPTLLAAPRASHGPLPRSDPPPPCAAPAHYLHEGRFEVQVCWINQHNDDQAGEGTPIAFSETSGLFRFFNPENIEMVINVIDGRRLNGHWWVHMASLTDVNWMLTIRDTQTGAVWSHTNPPGEIDPVLDPEAFVDLNEVPTLSEWGLVLLVLLLLGSGIVRLRSLRSHS